ncbi:MAG: GNAT family protein [Gammaproteobacteria bacterium]|nr:GNAT family protein [Gammaproteobacteria bacterium]
MPYLKIPDEFPVLRRNGLLLRELNESDLPAWYARLTDAKAASLAGDPVATSMSDVEEGLAHHRRAFAEKEGIRWALVPDEIGTSVGSFGFGNFDEPNLSVGLGGAVARKHWGRGFASTAGAAIVEYAFEVLEMERIQAETLTVNAAAARVLEKLGFEREGLMRGYRVYKGERRDFYLYALLKESNNGSDRD